jgi:hypothetical protein
VGNFYGFFVAGFSVGALAMRAETIFPQGTGGIVFALVMFFIGTVLGPLMRKAPAAGLGAVGILGLTALAGIIDWRSGLPVNYHVIYFMMFINGMSSYALFRIFLRRTTRVTFDNSDSSVVSFEYGKVDTSLNERAFVNQQRKAETFPRRYTLYSERIPKLESELKSAKTKIADMDNMLNASINGQIFANLQRAVTDFPTRYPQYSERFPKLDSDVRPWLKEAGIAANDREAHVFSSILSEHFCFT